MPILLDTMVKRIQPNQSKKQGGKNLYGIKQGVGQVTKSPYPTPQKRQPKPKKKSNGSSENQLVLHGLNALHPAHLSLPRAVGGYMPVKTTDILMSSYEANLFGVFKGPRNDFTETCWLNTVAVTNVYQSGAGINLPIKDTTGGGNAIFHESASLKAGGFSGAKMVPAAITVQIMNGTNLQSANGIAYIGRSKTVLDLMGDGRTWDELMKEMISYSAPRLCSAGKLALRGVEINAIPNNMSVLSDFVPSATASNGRQTWTQATYPCDLEGFGPIFVYNPDRIHLQYVVTIEWRVRFDPLNPAYAGHSVHKPATEATWSKVINTAESLGNGVRDIADVVASFGAAASSVRALSA